MKLFINSLRIYSKLISFPETKWDSNETLILGHLSDLTRVRQYSLFSANLHSSDHEFVTGASVNMSPSILFSNMWYTACFSMRCSFMWRIWLNHCSRRDLTHEIRSNVRVSLCASSLIKHNQRNFMKNSRFLWEILKLSENSRIYVINHNFYR